jgi:hypothetical protein
VRKITEGLLYLYFVKYIYYNILCYILNITNMDRRDRMADLQLTMKPVAITTNVVSSNAAHGDVYSIQLSTIFQLYRGGQFYW